MRKSIGFIVILLFLFLTNGCSKEKPNVPDEILQNNEILQNAEKEKNTSNLQEKEEHTSNSWENEGDSDSLKIKREVCFLDENTLFSAEFPENWYVESRAYDISEVKLWAVCMDSEQDGFQKTNFFYLKIAECPEGKSYGEYEKSSFEFADGQTGCRYTREYTEEELENSRYHAEILLLPGERFSMSCSETRDLHLTVSRYQRNGAQLLAFYRSILYQEQAERIGRVQEEAVNNRERVRICLHNRYLNITAVVPEGIVYDAGKVEYRPGREDFRLCLYLDEEKENYVEIYSDQSGIKEGTIAMETGLQADFLDSGELVYFYEWEHRGQSGYNPRKGERFLQYQYAFEGQSAGARIYVEKTEMDLIELAQEIIKSVRFPSR